MRKRNTSEAASSGQAAFTRGVGHTLANICLRSEDAFVKTCVANLMEVKVLYGQQDPSYEIYGYWRFNV
jgi:hypothetical protein